MTVYATRLVNGTDTRESMRRADAMGLFPSGPGTARPGLRRDGGGAVTVNAGTMTVEVSPFTAWVDGGVSDAQGGYTFVSDATETLTLTAGHATLERTDVAIAEVRDTTHDGSGSTDARLRILEGTPGSGVPALPTNALALRNITVPAGLSAGTGGLTSGNLSTDRRTYTTGLGGIITVGSQAERDSLGGIPGTVVYRSDIDQVQVRGATDWSAVPVGVGPWIEVTSFSNGWTNAPGRVPARYKKVGGIVYVQCHLTGGTIGAAAFSLPAGYRPGHTIPIPGADGSFEVFAGTGNVVPYPATTTTARWVASFPADA